MPSCRLYTHHPFLPFLSSSYPPAADTPFLLVRSKGFKTIGSIKGQQQQQQQQRGKENSQQRTFLAPAAHLKGEKSRETNKDNEQGLEQPRQSYILNLKGDASVRHAGGGGGSS
jgi:hypothetical protein